MLTGENTSKAGKFDSSGLMKILNTPLTQKKSERREERREKRETRDER